MKIFILENDKEYGERLASALKYIGNDIYLENSPDKVNAIDLKDKAIDLALIDRRLLDHNDPDDISGEIVAKALVRDGVPTAIITGHMPSGDKLFEMIHKNEISGVFNKSILTIKELAPCVNYFFFRKTFPNGIAKFKWWDGSDEFYFSEFWTEIMRGLESISNDFIEYAVLLRSMLPSCATKVEVKKISAGHSGASLFRARITSGDAPVQANVAIKYGKRSLIKRESMNYDRFVSVLPDGAAARLKWRSETGNLGALSYSWVGDSVEDGIPFGPPLIQKIQDVDDISKQHNNTENHNNIYTMTWKRRKNCIRQLFERCLDCWYVMYRNREVSIPTHNYETLLEHYTGKEGLWYGGLVDLNELNLPQNNFKGAMSILNQGNSWLESGQ